MNVLVAAPHPDDESIGCGGALRAHVTAGDKVGVVFLTSGEEGLAEYGHERALLVREREARRAAAILEVASVDFLRLPDTRLSHHVDEAAAALVPRLEAEPPDVVYVPHEADDHTDHRATLAAVRLALTGLPIASPALLAYEVWTPLSRFDEVVDIGAHLPAKLRAVRSYRSQVRYCRYDLAVKGLNAYRGALVGGSNYAEVFARLSH